MTYEMFQQGASVYVPVILISLIITIAVYCAFPLIFAKARKAEITKKKYKLLCYGINILLCLTFAFINGGATSFLPYLIWTCVFSNVGIKIMKRKGIIADVQSTDPASPTPSKSIETKAPINIDSEEPSTFVNEIQGLKGNITEAPKDKKSYKTVSIVLAVALIISAISITALIANLHNAEKEFSDLNSKYETLRDSRASLISELNSAENDLIYLSTNAVFVTTTGSKYHRYDCHYLDGSNFWIYNVELAEYKGYEPCSQCWPF